jgi:hypothetical protein
MSIIMTTEGFVNLTRSEMQDVKEMITMLLFCVRMWGLERSRKERHEGEERGLGLLMSPDGLWYLR